MITELMGLAGGLFSGSAAPAGPVTSGGTFSPAFSPVTLGPRYLGSDAVSAAPRLEAPAWLRVVPWVLGGIVVLVIAARFIPRRKD